MSSPGELIHWTTLRQLRDDRREALLRAIARSFGERGYLDTSLDDIARQRNLATRTVFDLVGSKDQSLHECIRIALHSLQSAIAEVESMDGYAADKLIFAMRRYALITTSDFGMCLNRVGEDRLLPASRSLARALRAEIDLRFRDLIQHGIAEGSLAPTDPRLAAHLLLGALDWIGSWYRPDGALSAEQIAEQCIGVLINGMLRD